MSTVWGTRHPGDDIAIYEHDNGASLIIGGIPDWVRTPAELGSEQFRVVSSYQRSCPCGGDHSAKTFVLDGTDIQVSECLAGRGFLWWQPPK